MGYLSRLSGKLVPDHPFVDEDIPVLTGSEGGLFYLDIERSETRLEGVAGVLVVKSAVSVSCVKERLSMYRMEEELVKFLRSLPARSWSGEIVREGEESLDVEAYRVVDGHVEKRRAVREWAEWENLARL